MLRREYRTETMEVDGHLVEFFEGKFDSRINYYYPTHFWVLKKYVIAVHAWNPELTEEEERDLKYEIALEVARGLKENADMSDIIPVVLYDVNEYTDPSDIIEGTLPEE